LTSPYLSADAFRLAIADTKNGKNVEAYIETVGAFEKLLPIDALAQLDTAWIENKTKKVKAETDRLEHELKTYKNNLIKESIRVRAKLKQPQFRMSYLHTWMAEGAYELGDELIAVLEYFKGPTLDWLYADLLGMEFVRVGRDCAWNFRVGYASAGPIATMP
jgi:hypothetical protein